MQKDKENTTVKAKKQPNQILCHFQSEHLDFLFYGIRQTNEQKTEF